MDETEQDIADKIKELQNSIVAQNNTINSLVKIIEQLSTVIADNKKLSEENKIAIDNLPYEIMSPAFRDSVFFPSILSKDDTVGLIKEGFSVSRFGDGEFSIIFGKSRWKFQPYYEDLQTRLSDILLSKAECFIPCINPNFFGPVFNLPDENDRLSVRCFLEESGLLQKSKDIFSKDISYGDALCFYIESFHEKACLEEIFSGRDITIVEGEKTRLGVGNDFLSKAKSVRRILCPSIDAWSKYSEILDAALIEDKERLFIISLGPTASVLSYDLYKAGYQALDVGHADIVYERFLGNPNGNLEFKDYVNGGEGIDGVVECRDEKYLSEIINII